MTIPPFIVATARNGWNWQWNQLMNGLAPSDNQGRYNRPKSQCPEAIPPAAEDLQDRSKDRLPSLIIGRSCPWAHRTWLVYELRKLESHLNLIIAKVDSKGGRWEIVPDWMGCNTLQEVYQSCEITSKQRATVPALIDPGNQSNKKPILMGNESAQLIEVLNSWPTIDKEPDLAPKNLRIEIQRWQTLLQESVNNGVYRCGFARNQKAYDESCKELFEALEIVENSLTEKGPWICGDQITLADVRLFPTLIRWEMVYLPLFGCSQKPLWAFPKIWEWRQNFFNLPKIKKTCDSLAWRNDYFGALFPLRPSNIVPAGPDLDKMVNAKMPSLQ